MSDSFVGEVRAVGFNFAPVGWMLCNGQLLSIAQFSTVYALLGTTYGGDGQTTFALPNLQSRIPIHQGTGGGQTYVMGQVAGVESVTLTIGSYPSHTHVLSESTNAAAGGQGPANNAVCGGKPLYTSDAANQNMNGSMIGASGSSLPHDNIQPYLVLNWIISLYGVYPSQG
jgi:microcystin-dependent protein